MAKPGLSYLDVAAALLLGMLALALILVAMTPQRRTGGAAQHRTQLRGIHQSLVTFAQSNKSYFPGALPTGVLSRDAVRSLRGASIVRLANEDFYSLEYLISPRETDPAAISSRVTSTSPGTQAAPAPGGSFAILDYRGSSKLGERLSTLGKLEWKEAMSTTAIVIADRQLTANPRLPRSIWAKKPNEWHGSVLYNDNHVSYELTDKGYVGKYGCNTCHTGTGTLNNLFDMLDGDGQLTVD